MSEETGAPKSESASTEGVGPTDAEVRSDPAKSADPPKSEAKPEPSPLEQAQAEAAKYREQLLRTAADFDNFRKRSRREAEDAQRKGKESAIKEILPIFDNLARALASADNAPDAKSVADGLKMIFRQYTSTLDRMNVKKVETVGKPFDPSLHEAIQHVESAEHAAGVIATEVQAGYTIEGHLLRAAMVCVSKGPAEKPADAGSDGADGEGQTPN
ncbi:MAG: nucleotide exchange factor GrpE [Polyangiaceae bacterium]